MTLSIHTAFATLAIELTPQRIQQFEYMVAAWELRKSHALALNSQALGVHAIAFTDADRQAFFDLVAVDPKDLKLLIQKISAINQDFRVISDPFNLLSIWLMHLAYGQISDHSVRASFMLAVAKYLHYRFFTSLVNHFYPHGVNEKVMTATIMHLSKKFDIIIYGTWRKAIEARCLDLISASSIHRSVFEHADNDVKFLYVLSDIQTRVRDKIKNVTNEYHVSLDRGDAVKSHAATIEVEGEKMLVHTTSTLDIMVYNLSIEILTPRLFADNQTITAIAKQFTNISEDMLRTALLKMVDIANDQRDGGHLDQVSVNDGQAIYIGMRVLIKHLIQKSYRYCMRNGVNITNNAAIYLKLKNVYASSRINDEDILANKQSVSYLVDTINMSRRETTKSSLRLAILLYILMRSFRFI